MLSPGGSSQDVRFDGTLRMDAIGAPGGNGASWNRKNGG